MDALFDNFDGRKMLALVPYWRPLAEGVIPPPVANSLDLSCAELCPNKCYFCNVRWTQQGHGNMVPEVFAEVLKVYKHFGVKSCCIAGGGESLVNQHCEQYFRDIIAAGTQIGIITNGRIYREIPKECRFINVSINAASPEVYESMCGVHGKVFHAVCDHIRRWVNEGQNVTYKVLMTDRNKSPLLLAQAVEKAAELGCKTVLFRFAMLPWDRIGKQEEYTKLTDLEADLFESHVAILRKHYPQLNIQMPLERYDRSSRKFTPKHCTGGAVNFVTLWNGDCYLCSDFRTCFAMKLCYISDMPHVWGSEEHKAKLAGVNVNNCPRCSFLMHDTIVDQFVYHDVSNQFFI